MSPVAVESKKIENKRSWLRLSWRSLWRTYLRNWKLLYLLFFLMIEIDRKHSRHELLFLTTWIACCLIWVLYTFSLQLARDAVIRRALEGKYEASLQWNKRMLRFPGFGGSVEGWILLEAGRYNEAEAATEPLAFDQHGNQRLMSWQLYYYAMALSHQGRGEEAYHLLGYTLQLKPRIGRFHLGLADCLLEHNRDPENARFMLDRILANWQEPSRPFRRRARQALHRARFAWALARCSRRDEAASQLLQTSAGSAEFIGRDQAWLRYYAGETWRALGDSGKAQAAFEEARALHPYGQVARRAVKGLAEVLRSV